MTVVFVDIVNGSDDNPGTSTQPFASLTAAVQSAQALPLRRILGRLMLYVVTSTMGLTTMAADAYMGRWVWVAVEGGAELVLIPFAVASYIALRSVLPAAHPRGR